MSRLNQKYAIRYALELEAKLKEVLARFKECHAGEGDKIGTPSDATMIAEAEACLEEFRQAKDAGLA